MPVEVLTAEVPTLDVEPDVGIGIAEALRQDDEKFGHWERYSGPTSDFKEEKEGYRPDVKLNYIDDDGRVLNAKEAFSINKNNYEELIVDMIKRGPWFWNTANHMVKS
ncbi:uncharacterized protein LOC111864881 [Cryptotermes secundus]|uniref:uncharacterized protein LOC111864881 n=1 Tax=Cryptotermes secundus TaxID=105785 RepID=UPI000CD7ADF9|nr:uncharacterized protein LOC111864881 [Cryptotermes secundus]